MRVKERTHRPGPGAGGFREQRSEKPRCPCIQKPCSEEQGFPYFEDKRFEEIEAREIDGEDGTKVMGQGPGCKFRAMGGTPFEPIRKYPTQANGRLAWATEAPTAGVGGGPVSISTGNWHGDSGTRHGTTCAFALASRQFILSIMLKLL